MPMLTLAQQAELEREEELLEQQRQEQRQYYATTSKEDIAIFESRLGLAADVVPQNQLSYDARKAIEETELSRMGVRKKRAQRPPSPLSYYDFGAVVKRIPHGPRSSKGDSTGNLSGFSTGALDTSVASALTRSIQMTTNASRISLASGATALLQAAEELKALAPVDVVRGEHRRLDRTVKGIVEANYPPLVTGDPAVDAGLPAYTASEMVQRRMIATRAAVERLAAERLSPSPKEVARSLHQSWAALPPAARSHGSRASVTAGSEASAGTSASAAARRVVRSASAEHMLEPIFCPTGTSSIPPPDHPHEFVRCSKLSSLFADHPSFSMQERAFRAAEDIRRGREREKMEAEARERHLGLRESDRARLLERQRERFWASVGRREPHALRQLRDIRAVRDEEARRDVADFEIEGGEGARGLALLPSRLIGDRLSDLSAAAARIALAQAAHRAAAGLASPVDPRALYGASGLAYVGAPSKGPDSLQEAGVQMIELEQFGERVRAMQKSRLPPSH